VPLVWVRLPPSSLILLGAVRKRPTLRLVPSFVRETVPLAPALASHQTLRAPPTALSLHSSVPPPERSLICRRRQSAYFHLLPRKLRHCVTAARPQNLALQLPTPGAKTAP
jgi:hypothetical protein